MYVVMFSGVTSGGIVTSGTTCWTCTPQRACITRHKSKNVAHMGDVRLFNERRDDGTLSDALCVTRRSAASTGTAWVNKSSPSPTRRMRTSLLMASRNAGRVRRVVVVVSNVGFRRARAEKRHDHSLGRQFNEMDIPSASTRRDGYYFSRFRSS